MPGQGREPKRARPHVDHPDRPIPGAGHPDDILISDTEWAPLPVHELEACELRRRSAVEIRLELVHQLRCAQVAFADPRPVAAVKERPVAILLALHFVGADVWRITQ